jgi:hypothetical protein
MPLLSLHTNTNRVQRNKKETGEPKQAAIFSLDTLTVKTLHSKRPAKLEFQCYPLDWKLCPSCYIQFSYTNNRRRPLGHPNKNSCSQINKSNNLFLYKQKMEHLQLGCQSVNPWTYAFYTPVCTCRYY